VLPSREELFEVEAFDPLLSAVGARSRLPGHVRPLPGEALGSWLFRYAEPFGVHPEMLLFRSDEDELISGVDWWRRPEPILVDTLAQRTGASVERIEAMTFMAWSADSRDSEIVERFARTRFRAGRPAVRQMRRVAVCPRCLAEDSIPYIRRNWAVGWVAVCTVHGSVLLNECLDCGAKLRMPRLSSGSHFAPHRCSRCGFKLTGAMDRRAHHTVTELQVRLLEGRARGAFNLPESGPVDWLIIMALFDVLLGAIWTDTKPKARRQLFARIARDLGRDELGDDPAGNYEGMLILAWMLNDWPERARAAISILRAPRPRRQVARQQHLEEEIQREVEKLLISAWPDESHDPDRARWRSWIDNLPETGDKLRAMAGEERFAHRRMRLHAIADVRDGVPIEAAADAAGVEPRTLYRWLRRGAVGGLNAALDRPSGALSHVQVAEIAEWIAAAPTLGPRRRIQSVQDEVLRRFNLQITQHVAKRLLSTYRPRPRRRAAKPSRSRPVNPFHD
jgi:transposase